MYRLNIKQVMINFTCLQKGEIIVWIPAKKIENTKTVASYDVPEFSF